MHLLVTLITWLRYHPGPSSEIWLLGELDWGENTGAQREKFPSPVWAGVPAFRHPSYDSEAAYRSGLCEVSCGEGLCHSVGPRPCGKLAVGCRSEVSCLIGASGASNSASMEVWRGGYGWVVVCWGFPWALTVLGQGQQQAEPRNQTLTGLDAHCEVPGATHWGGRKGGNGLGSPAAFSLATLPLPCFFLTFSFWNDFNLLQTWKNWTKNSNILHPVPPNVNLT